MLLQPSGGQGAQFPGDFLTLKKYKALSDGFHTAYYVSADGKILDFVDLDRFEKQGLTEKHHYPYWAEPIARSSRKESRKRSYILCPGGFHNHTITVSGAILTISIQSFVLVAGL